MKSFWLSSGNCEGSRQISMRSPPGKITPFYFCVTSRKIIKILVLQPPFPRLQLGLGGNKTPGDHKCSSPGNQPHMCGVKMLLLIQGIVWWYCLVWLWFLFPHPERGYARSHQQPTKMGFVNWTRIEIYLYLTKRKSSFILPGSMSWKGLITSPGIRLNSSKWFCWYL